MSPTLAAAFESADPNLVSTVRRNLLRWAVGQAITCRYCRNIMDCANAVLVTGPPEDKSVWLGCATCWGQGAHTWEQGGWCVLDGRTLFPQPKRWPPAARVKSPRKRNPKVASLIKTVRRNRVEPQ